MPTVQLPHCRVIFDEGTKKQVSSSDGIRDVTDDLTRGCCFASVNLLICITKACIILFGGGFLVGSSTARSSCELGFAKIDGLVLPHAELLGILWCFGSIDLGFLVLFDI